MPKFHHFGKILRVFCNFLRVYFVFGILLTLFGQIWYVIAQIFIDVNGQKMKKSLAMWSHCQRKNYFLMRRTNVGM